METKNSVHLSMNVSTRHHHHQHLRQAQAATNSYCISTDDDEKDDEISKFLFLEKKNDSTVVDERNMKSIRSTDACWFALSLMPMEVRNERVIMVFEAYTIFGALFFAATWVVYEWGSPKAYSADNSEPDEVVGRLFEFVMALAIVCKSKYMPD